MKYLQTKQNIFRSIIEKRVTMSSYHSNILFYLSRNIFSMVILYFIIMVMSIACKAEPSIEVRKITPPQLSEQHLGKRILCHRPMRKGSPAMYVQKMGDKIIAHNYGHGGSGWTLGPGAVKYVIELLRGELTKKSLQKDEPIVVIGGGVIGYLSASELLEQGYSDITIVADSFEELASHNAGALLAPVSMDNNPKMQRLINRIGVEAYKFYKNIAEGKNLNFTQSGVCKIPAYFENREDSGLEPYVGIVMSPAKDVLLDFQNGTTHKMVAYDDGIFINTHQLMQDLSNFLKDKIKFEKRKIHNFKTLKQRIILNCTGLGSKNLVKDQKMISVQGHLIMLKDQNPSDINHMILVYFDKGKTKSNFKIKRSLYMFPKRLPGYSKEDIGVIGGTFIEGADKDTPHEEEFEIMLEAAKKFYGIKK